MPVHATRKIRNAAAVLMLAAGISHISQLWMRDIDAPALLLGLVGMYYLVLALGLSGRSRFTLWITSVSVIASASWGIEQWSPRPLDPLLSGHILADITVACLCLYILYRTRHSTMD
jgi:hypothetical protein